MIGIYCITNNINCKKYIGQSWNIEHRFAQHKCKCENTYLSRAINKYGFDNFTFSIIREIKSTGITQVLLDVLETHYINMCNTRDRSYGYNIKSGGGGGGLWPQELKKRLSDSKKGHPVNQETRDSISKAKKGVPWSAHRRGKYLERYVDNPNYEKRESSMKGKPWSNARRAAYNERWGK